MKRLSVLILSLFLCFFSNAQTEISGVINDYAIVSSHEYSECFNQITIDDASAFQMGDQVLMIQMKDAQINESNGTDFGTINDIGKSGLYEINEIDSIDGNNIFLKYQIIQELFTANTGILQLIRMPVYDDAIVTDVLTADVWDGVTGGVLAFQVNGQLILDADIDVSAKGLRGGIATTASSNNCSWLTQQNDYFYNANSWRGSAKGEGVANIIAGKEHGKGAQANGGGGGNDHNSGGGGGANVTSGGQGGENDEPSTFGCKGFHPGVGGKAIVMTTDRLFLGGGGGAGHENNEVATDGGNGGGIVIMIVNEFIPLGYRIRAAGETPIDGGGDGGGGGGAGGTILLDIQSPQSTIYLELEGGDGGLVDNSNVDRCHGPGGGGSGGRVISNLVGSGNLLISNDGGEAGMSINSSSCGDGTNGAEAGEAGTLEDLDIIAIANETFNFPIAGFNFTINGGVVNFSNQSENEDTYDWDFGDTFSDNVSDPNHTYAESGTYEVELIVSNACGMDTIVQEIIIELDDAPSAFFTLDIESGCAPLVVNFMDASLGDVENYEWTFVGGNPLNSSLQNPQVTYSSPGFYDVQLSISGPGGSDVFVLENAVEVLAEPIAGFNFTINGGVVNFSNQSENEDTYDWDFGDTFSDNVSDPNHTYAESGTYEVELIVSNACGMDTIVQEIIIELDAAPSASFTLDIESGCAPLVVNFMDASLGDVENYEWTFVGGNPLNSSLQNPQVTYSSPGFYDVQLSISGPGGSDVFVLENAVEVLAEPIAGFNFTINGGVVNFSNQSENEDTYDWDFGDTFSDNVSDPNHTYAESGTYEVELIVSNACGMDTIVQEVVVEIVEGVNAQFTLDDGNGCAPWIVNFTNLSSGDVEDYLWTFEGGIPATSTEANPQVIYNTPGVFDVQLEISGSQGSDLILVENQVVISPQVNASFQYTVNDSEVSFINESINANNYQWDFGDGSSVSTLENPIHDYTLPGTYLVTMSASSIDCGSVIAETIFLDFVDVADLGKDNFIKLFPNPVGSFVNIETSLEGQVNLKIYSIDGKEMKDFREMFFQNKKINTENLKAGVYVLSLEYEGYLHQLKLIKL